MNWNEIRQLYPDRWAVIEAVKSHSENARRILDDIRLVKVCDSGEEAWSALGELHLKDPLVEFYPVHTSRSELMIRERICKGISRRIKLKVRPTTN